ncbi:hypothetical protein AAVH_22890 [Aphelenchoides avenae]|nr:hypothetical protein AAVH_22890 [Aphelenchus avenae]
MASNVAKLFGPKATDASIRNCHEELVNDVEQARLAMATQTCSPVRGSIAVEWTAGRPLGRVRSCDASQIDGCPALSDLLQIKVCIIGIPVEERRGKQKLGLASKAGSCALCLTYRSGGGDTGLTHKVVAVTSQCAYYNVPSHNITITARSLAVTLDQFREQLIAYEVDLTS